MRPSNSLLYIAVIVSLCAPPGFPLQQTPPSGERVNQDSLIVGDFLNRINEYMKIHKKVSDKLPGLKTTTSPEKIEHHERGLAHGIREAREHAHAGDIFTPEIADLFRRLIAQAMQGSDGTRVHQSLRRAEPVKVELRINRPYPAGVPLQSSPPTLLANLPKLPKELDYRIVGPNLILRDVDANLVVDFIPKAIP